jgi:hypothetical protein
VRGKLQIHPLTTEKACLILAFVESGTKLTDPPYYLVSLQEF